MKKILIALLAVAVIFSFAACDNSSEAPATDPTSNPIVRIYQGGETVEYLVGQVPELADFVVMAQRADGTTEQLAADDVVFTARSTAAAGTDSTVATVSLLVPNLVYASTTTNISFVADVYAVDSIEAVYNGSGYDQYYQSVVGATVNGETATVDSVFHKSQYTVTAIYDTDREYVLSSDEYVVSNSGSGNFDATAPAVDAAVTISLDLDKNGTADSVSATATVDGLVIVADELEGISIALNEDEELIAGAAVESTLANIFTVTASYASDKTTTVTATTLEFDTDTLANEGANYPATGNVTVEATYEGKTATLNVPVTPNYITEFEVTGANNLTAQAGATLADIISVTATWADEDTATIEDEDLTVVTSPVSMPNQASAIVTVSVSEASNVDPINVIVRLASSAPGQGDGGQ